MEYLAYPNESPEYRAARIKLLDAEMALRRQIEAVSAMRRALPPGGTIKEDMSSNELATTAGPSRCACPSCSRAIRA